MTLKKLLAVLLALAMLLSMATVFVGCDSEESSQSDDEDEDEDEDETKDDEDETKDDEDETKGDDEDETKGDDEDETKGDDEDETEPEETEPEDTEAPEYTEPEETEPEIEEPVDTDLPAAAEEALKMAFEMEIGANEAYLKDCVPAAVWDYYEYYMEYTYDELVAYYDNYVADFTSYYGEDAQLEYVILSSQQGDDSDLDIVAEVLEYDYEVDSVEVSDCYVIDLELIINDESLGEGQLILACCDGDWYVMNLYEYDGEYEIAFYADSIVSSLAYYAYEE